MHKNLLLGLVVVFICTANVQADDYNPPGWRGQPGTVRAVWDTWTPGSTGETYPADSHWPEEPFTDWPIPKAMGGGAVTGGVIEVDENHPLVFWLKNTMIMNPTKLIWMQLKLYAPYEPDDFNLTGIDWWPPGTLPPQGAQNFKEQDRTQDGNWLLLTYSASLPWNPTEEFLQPKFDFSHKTTYYIDQVVIDTWCIPEPATIWFGFGLVSLAMLRRKG